MNATEFRGKWLDLHPKTIHIPSEHEIDLMECYALYFHNVVKKSGDSSDKRDHLIDFIYEHYKNRVITKKQYLIIVGKIKSIK